MTTPDLPSLPSGSAVAPSARRSWQQSLTLALLALALLAPVRATATARAARRRRDRTNHR